MLVATAGHYLGRQTHVVIGGQIDFMLLEPRGLVALPFHLVSSGKEVQAGEGRRGALSSDVGKTNADCSQVTRTNPT
jgi:hypothetical protein